MKKAMPWYRTTFFLVTTTLALVAIGDWLFYRQPAGWNMGLWELVLLFVVVLTHRTALRTRAGKIILLALLGISAALMAQPGPLVALLALLGTMSFALIGRCGWTSQTGEWIWRWAIFGITAWFQILEDLLLYQRWRHKGHGSPLFARALTLLRNWMIPILWTGAFLVLFAIANPVISQSLQNIDTFLNFVLQKFHVDLVRAFFWIFLAVAGWALLRKRVMRKPRRASSLERRENPGLPQIVVRCLILFNALFAVQNLLDLRYLYGGAALPAGMTYAQYAHRGAYPLIVTALLAAAFVLVTFRPGGLTQHTQKARRLVVLWLSQNVLLTLAALWRLNLYVQIYSLTRWRLAAALWMLLVATGLAWTALRILSDRSNQWLVNVNFVTTLFVLFFCCFVNFEGMIAWYNVRHCNEMTGKGVRIDLAYLESLGPESIPPLKWLAPRVAPPLSGEALAKVDLLTRQLQRQLTNWRGWTLRYLALSRQAAPAREGTVAASRSLLDGPGGILWLRFD